MRCLSDAAAAYDDYFRRHCRQDDMPCRATPAAFDRYAFADAISRCRFFDFSFFAITFFRLLYAFHIFADCRRLFFDLMLSFLRHADAFHDDAMLRHLRLLICF